MTLGMARVIWTINDLSMFVDEVAMGYVTMVIKAERGPIADPKIISSLEEYRRIFGKKVDYTTDPLVVEMALRQGGRLNVIRTAHYTDSEDPTTLTALKSSVVLQDRGDVSTSGYAQSTTAGPYSITAAASGRVTGIEVGPYIIATGVNDKLKLRVGTGAVPEASQTVTLTEGTRTCDEIVDDINSGTTDITAINDGNQVLITATVVTKFLEIESVAHDAYSTLGFAEAAYPCEVGTATLSVEVDAGQAQVFTLTAGVRTAGQICTNLSALTGAKASVVDGKLKIKSDTTGTSSKIQITSTSTADTVLGLDNSLHAGRATGTQQDTLTIEAKDPGSFGDDLRIFIYDSPLDSENSFDLKVVYYRQGDMQEWYTNLSMDSTSQRYVVNYINERSQLIQVTDESSDTPSPMNRPEESDIVIGFALEGGDDGLAGFDDSDWIGDAAAQTGIYAADQAYMSMDLMVPGTTSATVYQALIAYCELRGDMIAYGQVPYGLDPEDCVDWRLGNAPYQHGAFNSHRFALFFGRPLVYDDLDDTRKYISCLGHLASCLCKTDNYYGYHFAPVGPRRGKVALCEGIDFNIGKSRSTGYGDLFAEYGINYLMISHFPGIEGAMFWEQRTTWRPASALRELNVVRFITIMNRMLMPVLRTFLFEPNHPVTWREIHRTLQPAFDDWKAKYAIYDYCLQTDRDAFFDGGVLKNAVINSGLDIDRGIYHCRALIQPTRTIYYLEFTLGVMRTGEAFSEYTEMKELPGWVVQ
jgi:hypothetical protein